MGNQQHDGGEREVSIREWRRAWIDGWTEGAIWALVRAADALRADRHPESVMGGNCPEHCFGRTLC